MVNVERDEKTGTKENSARHEIFKNGSLPSLIMLETLNIMANVRVVILVLVQGKLEKGWRQAASVLCRDFTALTTRLTFKQDLSRFSRNLFSQSAPCSWFHQSQATKSGKTGHWSVKNSGSRMCVSGHHKSRGNKTWQSVFLHPSETTWSVSTTKTKELFKWEPGNIFVTQRGKSTRGRRWYQVGGEDDISNVSQCVSVANGKQKIDDLVVILNEKMSSFSHHLTNSSQTKNKDVQDSLSRRIVMVSVPTFFVNLFWMWPQMQGEHSTSFGTEFYFAPPFSLSTDFLPSGASVNSCQLVDSLIESELLPEANAPVVLGGVSRELSDWIFSPVDVLLSPP